jgi:hypothetical protein
MPKLLETFDQLKMSSEIRSSDHFPIHWQWSVLFFIKIITNDNKNERKMPPLMTKRWQAKFLKLNSGCFSDQKNTSRRFYFWRHGFIQSFWVPLLHKLSPQLFTPLSLYFFIFDIFGFNEQRIAKNHSDLLSRFIGATTYIEANNIWITILLR